MPCSVLLFSFEGVLADTAPLLRSALRESLSAEGLDLRDDEWFDHCDGLGTADAVEQLLAAQGEEVDPTASELIVLRAERHVLTRSSYDLHMRPGASTLLGSLGGRARAAIVTRLPRSIVDAALQLANIEHSVQCIVAAEHLQAHGASRSLHELAIERLHRRVPVDRSSVIALEGSTAGIESARAAGLWCLAVGPMPAWQRMCADAWLERLEGTTFPDIVEIARNAR